MNQFVQKVANYVANEILIKGLANSKTFQKIAVRTDSRIQHFKKNSNEQMNSKLDELHKSASQSTFSSSNTSANIESKKNHRNSPPKRPLTGIPGFLSAFSKEIIKDLNRKT